MNVLIPLFSPSAGTYGSLTRTLSMANTLKNSGHAVLFCTSGQMASLLAQKGYEAAEMPASTMFGLPRLISNIIEKRSQKMQLPVKEGKAIGSIWFVHLLSGTAKKSYLLRQVEALRKTAESFKPDLILTEMDLGAYLLSRINNIPLATTYASVMENGKGTMAWRKVRGAMNAVLRRYGCEPVDPQIICFNSDILKLIPSIPELDGAPEREDIHYVGNMIERIIDRQPAIFQPESDKKYVFVYMGTGSVSLTNIETVLPETFAGLDNYRCIVAFQSISEEKTIGNVQFKPYIQADELLPYCEWTICHGGLNSITQSLEYQVPLIIFPGPIFERRFNAEKVAGQKAGFMGEFSDFNPEWIRRMMQRHEEARANAERLSERFKSYGGSPDALKAIEKWLER